MSQRLTIEMSDGAYEGLTREAVARGTTPALVASSALERQFSNGTAEEQRLPEKEAPKRHGFQSVFGIVSLPESVGLDNEQIDADLAREYGDSHENC
jgi:hypothetical protein